MVLWVVYFIMADWRISCRGSLSMANVFFILFLIIQVQFWCCCWFGVLVIISTIFESWTIVLLLLFWTLYIHYSLLVFACFIYLGYLIGLVLYSFLFIVLDFLNSLISLKCYSKVQSQIYVMFFHCLVNYSLLYYALAVYSKCTFLFLSTLE